MQGERWYLTRLAAKGREEWNCGEQPYLKSLRQVQNEWVKGDGHKVRERENVLKSHVSRSKVTCKQEWKSLP